jgi:hypothetical protein
MKQFPLLTIPTQKAIESDIHMDLNYSICSGCKCVQLSNLLDPAILYSYPNKSSLTPLWVKHHTTFVDFIKENYDVNDSICELGGANNPLVDYFTVKPKTYSVLDLFIPNDKRSDIEYITGNIEQYTEYKEDILILSHTFEHLYNPRCFFKAVSESNVRGIFISVPNMRAMLEKKTSVSIVFSEHTFFFEKEDIEYMAALYGFECKSFYKFQDHSLFFYLTRNNAIKKELHVKDEAVPLLVEHFFRKEEKIRKINLEDDTYIMPSHYIGQIIYHFIDKKEKILGFLDNDTNKREKRLYGTPCLAYNPSIISEKEKIHVLLINNSYQEEMIAQLKSINQNIQITLTDI